MDAPRSRRIGALAALAAVLWVGSDCPAAKYSPDSPEVRKLVDRAIKFLESEEAGDERPGARALVGLALLKSGAKASHPKIVQAVQKIQSLVRAQEAKSLGLDVYSTGLCIIFLVTLDSSKYAPEIDILLAYLQSVQKSHGGWGYPTRETGDTSMTQYAVLSSWEATQAGFRVPRESIEAVANWLIKTQDPGGGFGYQGKVAEGPARVKQSGVRLSMVAAGLGSVYICADLLGMTERVERDEDLPRALKEVKVQQPRGPDAGKSRVEFPKLRESQSAGNSWMRANYEINPKAWTFYYMYALERYWSFRQATEGAKDDRWYDEGVRFLMRSQNDDGSWSHREKYEMIDTAFGVLFLLRSSKKSIERAYMFNASLAVGGRGLPRDTSRVELRGGTVMARPTKESIDRVLSVLEDSAHPDHREAVQMLSQLPTAEARSLLAGRKDRLAASARSGSPAVRVAAIRALAGSGDLDHVPTLIEALGAEDPAVFHAAEQGLEQIRRRLGGSEGADRPTQAQRQAAIEGWKAWYLSVRPDARFHN